MGIIQRQGLRSAIVRVVGMAIGAITTIFLIPAILSVEDIGLIDTMRKMITIGVPLLVMGGPQAIRKYFDPMRSENQSYTLISSYLCVFIFTATIFTLAYFGLKDQIFSIYQAKSPQIKAYSLVIYMGLMGLAVQNFCMAISSVHRRTVVPDFAQNVMNRGILLILLLLVFLNSMDIPNIPRVYTLIFFILPPIATTLYVSRIIKPSLQWPSRATIAKIYQKTFLYNLVQIPLSLSNVILLAVDSIMLSSLTGLASTGVYSIALFMISFLNVSKRSLTQISLPIVSGKFKEEKIEEIRTILRNGAQLMTFSTGLLVIALVNGIEILLSIMPNGELFAETRLVLYILGIATLTDHLFGLQQMLINTSSKYVLGLVNFLAIVALVIVLNLLLIPIYGIYGAAITTAIGLVLRAAFNALIMYKSTSLHAFTQKSLLTYSIALLCIAGSFILQENIEWHYRSLAQGLLMPMLFLTTCVIASCVPQQVNQWMQKVLKRM
ncbi:MAG: polysaccharide biosynthesis C-terminal domain-containing protein [Bacteroidota bacterium]|nr:polysaccharide biosynthesis C-terminal domain-containing protein [Bacteroidota bacterium]